MRKSTIEKLFEGDYDAFRIMAGTLCDGDTGHHWTTLLVGSKVCRVQEYANEADGFEVWLPVEGNSIRDCRRELGLPHTPEPGDPDYDATLMDPEANK